MEEETPVKSSVAQLAGRLRGHALPMPGNTEVKSMRRSQCSLQLNNQTDENTEHEKPSIDPHPAKMKIKSSPLIEKLQANLALSPTILLTPPKSPETKQPPTDFNSSSPCSSVRSTLHPVQLSCEDEMPVCFEQPAEGTPLTSMNKSRARLSFKRRLPTRQHRKSACLETKSNEEDESTSQDSSRQNGDEDEILGGPLPKGEEDKMDSTHEPEPKEEDKDGLENKNDLQEKERTVNQQEVTEEVNSDEPLEEQQEETEKDQIGVKENEELIDTEKNPEEK